MAEIPDDEWYENGEYDGTDCTRCGRQRVMVCTAPNGSERRVCEKCRWDQDAGEFAALLDFAQAIREQKQ